MATDAKHPGYVSCIDDWILLRDVEKGERAVKEKGTEYLPATAGQIEDGQGTTGQKGEHAYQAYKTRALFHDFMADTVRRGVGILHRKPAVFELPASMQFLIDRATPDGQPLEMLLRKINKEQLAVGRIGLFADMPPEELRTEDLPVYIASYGAETMINWRDGTTRPGQPASLDLVVLDESGPVMDPTSLDWRDSQQYRILAKLEDNTYGVQLLEDGQDFDQEQLSPPQLSGSTTDTIPFVFINPTDIVTEPDVPPLLGLARLCLAIYRGEADYRRSLFNQGEDTLVTIGEVSSGDPIPETEAPVRIGAGARIAMEKEGDAKFIGVDSQGLPEQRMALENDKRQAEEMSVQLLDSKAAESGEALKVRREGRTATLTDIAKTGAAGLETILKMIATWHGANADEVSVTPNLDFADDEFTGEELKAWMESKGLGAPLSYETIHDFLRRREITVLTFEEEMDRIEAEGIAPQGTGAGGNGNLGD